MDLNHANLQALHTTYNTVFQERLTGVETTYGRIAMTVPSTSRSQHYPRLSELGPMREWVGERFIERLEHDGFTLTNKKYEKTIAVPVDDIDDDQVGIYSPLMSDMGQVSAELPDDLVWPLLSLGFNTTHYDGQFFFDTDHPVEDANGNETSVSNFQGGAGSAWYLIDDSRMIKPMIFQDRKNTGFVAKTSLTDDNVFERDEFVWGTKRRCAAGFGAWQLVYASRQPLTAANYAAARQAMLEMRGHRGRKLTLMPRLLVVAPGNESEAREILMAERNAAGATNVWRNTADIHVENRLT